MPSITRAQVPEGEQSWSVVGTSNANEAVTVTKAASTGYRHRVWGFEAVIKAAAAGADITVDLKSGSTTIWSTVIGNAAARGTSVGVMFSKPLDCTVSEAVNLVISAGGASCVTVGSILGDTIG